MDNLTLYEQLLNLPTLKVDGVELEKDKIKISCHLSSTSCKCPTCGETTTQVHQSYERRLRDLNIAAREVYLLVKIRQFYCKHCNGYFGESLDFADANKSHTHRQERFIFMVARKQSYSETAAIVNVHPKTVERTVLSLCKQQVDVAARYAQVKRLGIDEQSHRKGKRDYLCVLTDLDRGILVDLLESRKKEDLVAHFQSLGPSFCAQITYVSCDGWKGYISAAQTCFPKATLVLDRFHVTEWMNDCVDAFRKTLRQSEAKNRNYRHLKWILYKQYHRLSDQELDKLEAAFQDCPLLKEVYWTRESFHHILDNGKQVEEVLKKIKEWVEAMSGDVKAIFKPFIKTLESSKTYIANYVKDALSNAVTEGLNNLIRSVRRVAFGMPNFEHLRWRALAISD